MRLSDFSKSQEQKTDSSQKVGATLVPEDTWREAPSDHIIIGLKELPVEECESDDFGPGKNDI